MLFFYSKELGVEGFPKSCPTGRFVAAEPFGALTDLFGACFGTFLLKEAWLPPLRKATEMPEVFVF